MAVRVVMTDAEFQSQVARERPRLVAHSYRMLASPHDAEDAVQEALDRAWRRLETYDGTGPFAGWLYRIATNVCIDHLRAAKRRGFSPIDVPASPAGTDLGSPDPDRRWIEPIPDRQVSSESEPGQVVVDREHVRLAFVAALQRLPARQRGALLLHDVVGFSTQETASMLEVSVGAVNGLLHRARATMIRRDERESTADPSAVEGLLQRYVEAWERADIDGLAAVVAHDVALAMPPFSVWFSGADAALRFVRDAIFAPLGPGVLSLEPCALNGSPGFVVRERQGDGTWRPGGVQVVEIGPGPAVASVTSFRDPAVIDHVAGWIAAESADPQPSAPI